jgi:putative acetyltransferase
MRTTNPCRRKGVGRAILSHIVQVAQSRSYERLSLETGSMEAFKPAHKLYESFGFTYCGPFGEYIEDPNSVFMTMRLEAVSLNVERSTARPPH